MLRLTYNQDAKKRIQDMKSYTIIGFKAKNAVNKVNLEASKKIGEAIVQTIVQEMLTYNVRLHYV